MANKISQSQIEEMIRLYAELGTYSAVAKKTGISASTVSKYIKAHQEVVNFKPDTTSTFAPKPIQEIPFEFIISFSYLTDEEKTSYEKWRKEFGR